MPDIEFESFKECVRIQAGLDLEAWDVMLFQPLKDLYNWWSRQSETTKAFTGFLASTGAAALSRWIARAASIASAEVAGLLAESLTVVFLGLAFGTGMDILGRCLIQIV